ncbi:hypothetical protein Salat_0178900 [Sesamum alatum]|uniref:Reverse transcriptase zinc-binding domain-containing protein n=1 Tax=Sesamum alatum TaxID=300844 RepID=A0AAE1YY56_9LAMI|nr:hypothetical protein Salat_0178900 [Sesamum alatum]
MDLGFNISLSEEERESVQVPLGVWKKGPDPSMTLVGRLLSDKPVNFEAFRTAILRFMNPGKEMVEGYVDPGRNTPFGPWLRQNNASPNTFTSTPASSFPTGRGAAFPTIARHSNHQTMVGNPVRRGSAIFGDFRKEGPAQLQHGTPIIKQKSDSGQTSHNACDGKEATLKENDGPQLIEGTCQKPEPSTIKNPTTKTLVEGPDYSITKPSPTEPKPETLAHKPTQHSNYPSKTQNSPSSHTIINPTSKTQNSPSIQPTLANFNTKYSPSEPKPKTHTHTQTQHMPYPSTTQNRRGPQPYMNETGSSSLTASKYPPTPMQNTLAPTIHDPPRNTKTLSLTLPTELVHGPIIPTETLIQAFAKPISSRATPSQVPERVRLFAWKTCQNAIPTVDNFARRGMMSFPGCPVCGEESEDVGHALLLCPGARLFWAISELPWRVVQEWNGGCEEWMRMAASKLDAGQFAWFLMVAWLIWNHRNKILMEGHQEDALGMITNTRRYFLAFSEAQVQHPDLRLRREHVKWHPPPRGFVKINFDGALLKQHHGAGAGAVARDETASVDKEQQPDDENLEPADDILIEVDNTLETALIGGGTLQQDDNTAGPFNHVGIKIDGPLPSDRQPSHENHEVD